MANWCHSGRDKWALENRLFEICNTRSLGEHLSGVQRERAIRLIASSSTAACHCADNTASSCASVTAKVASENLKPPPGEASPGTRLPSCQTHPLSLWQPTRAAGRRSRTLSYLSHMQDSSPVPQCVPRFAGCCPPSHGEGERRTRAKAKEAQFSEFSPER